MTTEAPSYAEYYGGVFPEEDKVLDAIIYGPVGNDLLGNYVTVVASQVLNGVLFGASSSLTGVFVVPAESSVLMGVGYGANGTEFIGEFVLPLLVEAETLTNIWTWNL